MQISHSSRYKFKQVLGITITWLIAGLIVELLYAINYDPASGSHRFHFVFGENGFQHLLITALGPLAGGLTGGMFIVFYQRDKLKGKTYGEKLLVHSGLYLSFVIFCILVVGTIGALNADKSFAESLREDIFSLRVLRLIITWYFIVLLTIFLLDVSEKYGAGILKKQLMGRYHSPVQEDRIFLFLDLRSSTAIAE